MKKIFFLLILTVLFIGCQTNKKLTHNNINKNIFTSKCQFGCHVVVKADGTLWSFGNQQLEEKHFGEIILDANSKAIPKEEEHISLAQKVGTDTNWNGVKVSIGRIHVYAIKKDGTLWKWNRELKYINAPIKVHQVTDSNDWKNVKVYTSHESQDCDNGTFSIKRDGSLWSWDFGYNEDAEPIDDSIPKKIATNSEWDKLVVTCINRYVLKTDGSLYRFRFNRFTKVDKASEDKDSISILLKQFSTIHSKSILIVDGMEEICE